MIAIPLPMAPEAKTLSSISNSGKTVPLIGETIVCSSKLFGVSVSAASFVMRTLVKANVTTNAMTIVMQATTKFMMPLSPKVAGSPVALAEATV
ncbi:hypothetical protein SDC9_182301 [bioreactor metagenome]|uniref:Uncharacterized protein n=1 Tax=bioreactor metagenome TaxID=1076179 RepID=A0A645H6Z4_9ZZZZ